MTTSTFQYLIPNSITLLRLVVSPLLFYFLILEQNAGATTCFFVIVISDVLDGHIARKLHMTSIVGGYFDAITDFIAVLFALTAFIMKEIYPLWILGLVGIMFGQFLLTSIAKKPVYDPIGKYYGTMLNGIIGTNLIYYDACITTIELICVMSFTFLSVISRLYKLYRLYRIVNELNNSNCDT